MAKKRRKVTQTLTSADLARIAKYSRKAAQLVHEYQRMFMDAEVLALAVKKDTETFAEIRQESERHALQLATILGQH